MCPFEFFQPKTLAEAIELLERGVPLAGGTALTPRRGEIPAVIDLRELGLDNLEIQNGTILIGAGLTLQKMVDAVHILPVALREVCIKESGWNLRNMATLGGVIMSGDGRSPLLTVLLALRAQVVFEPGGNTVPLVDLLQQREEAGFHHLITAIRLDNPLTLVYEQISRTPADRPIVCAAVAHFPEENAGYPFQVALGGFGSHPIRVEEAESILEDDGDIDAAAEACREVYIKAGDAWASSEYRSHTTGVLVRRLLMELIN